MGWGQKIVIVEEEAEAIRDIIGMIHLIVIVWFVRVHRRDVVVLEGVSDRPRRGR
jgi:tRNA (Thr-GGU) A37 N-methylase